MSTAKKKPDQEMESEQDTLEQHDETTQREEHQATAVPSEEVRAFAAAVRAHAHTRNTPFEPMHHVTLCYGYNGLLRNVGNAHVHVATHAEVAAMSDQHLHDAVLRAGKKHVV